MAISIKHTKTDNIADWTQADLDAAIQLGFYPPGTLLADIVLPSDWNAEHTIMGVVESVTGLNTDNTDPANPIVKISVDGVTITGAGTPGSPLIAVGAGSGTVTSVALSLPSFITVSGSPVTTSGTLTGTLASQSQNLVFASPNGSGGAPIFRAIVAADVPTLNQNTTGSAAKWTTARNLAGNSVDGSANVIFSNKFIVQGTTDAGLSAAQFLGALGTGIVKNTTSTGVLSIAIAADFPTLNQSTTGSAATLTTPRAINGVNFDGSAAITVTAAAGTLTGTTLASNVVTSSLTTVGTLGSLAVTNNATANNFISGSLGVIAAGGTTTLTITSPQTIYVFGSNPQTVKLPNASTLTVGTSYLIGNNVSGGFDVTVKDGGNNTIGTVAAQSQLEFRVGDVSTSPGGWTAGTASTAINSVNFSGSLFGDVGGTQSATTIADTVVTGKLLTGFVSGAGTVSATDSVLSAFNKINGNVAGKQATGNYITAITGDLVATGPGSVTGTLATVNSNTGSFGSSTGIPVLNLNGKGLVLSASTAAVIAPAGTLSGATLNSGVTASSLTSLGTQAQALNMGTHLINNVTDPSSAQDAATKNYVDNALANLASKPEVAYASTSALPSNTYSNGTSGVGATLTGTANGPLIVDGVTILIGQVGERVLVAGEAAPANNGWYTITQQGVVAVSPYILTRATESDQAAEIGAGYITAVVAPNFVTPGSSNNGKVFISVAADPFTVGTTSLTFSQVGTTYSAGTGLTLSGSTFSVNTSQSIATLSNLTSNGFVKTSGGGGTLSVDTGSYQPLDSDLTTIAGLTATTNNFIQSKSSAWASRTPTQVTADLIAFVADSGSGGTKGLVPAPAAGDAANHAFLSASGSFVSVTKTTVISSGSGTFTFLAGTTSAKIQMVGAGGSGGGGRIGAAASARFGGGGGAPGAYVEVYYNNPAGLSLSYAVGAGSAGGAGSSGTSVNGVTGTDGGNTTFDNITALGGKAGTGGTAAAGTGGALSTASNGIFPGETPSNGPAGGNGSTTAPTQGGSSVNGFPTGGGGGAGINASNVRGTAGANGGDVGTANIMLLTGGTGGTSAASGGGSDGSGGNTTPYVSGRGGGGGGSTSAGVAGNGGNGGNYGAGGGGGGAAVNGGTSGNGGSGASGILIVIEYS